MSKFWDNHRELIEEDVTATRERVNNEPIHASKRLTNALAIEIDMIEADPQHREDFDAESLGRLAMSLKSEGQLQPVRVRFAGDRGKYVIIAGERRWRAARMAGLTSVDCVVVKERLSEADILRQQIIENAVREDLKPTEQAKAFADLMEKEGWNGKELAEQLNVSAPTVSRMLALLKLPDEVQQQVDKGKLPITKALTRNSEGNSKAKVKKKRPSRERKVSTSVGITVLLKARKYLKDEEIVIALREAIEELEKAA